MKGEPVPPLPRPSTERTFRVRLAGILTLVAVGLVAYSNTFSVPFVFDDYENIRDNRELRLHGYSAHELWQAATSGPSSRRPLAMFTFALNQAFGADNVWGYHAVNLAVHLACGVLVFALGKCVLAGTGVPPGKVESAAFVAALAFVTHPLQTQAVTYIVQRMTVLAALFYLAALLCYVHGRTSSGLRRALAWCGVASCGVLSLGSKETAATLPLAILLIEAYLFQQLDRHWLRQAALVVIPVIVALAACAWWIPAIHEALFGTYSLRKFTMGERVLTQPRVIVFYLSLFCWPLPSRLSITHDFAVSQSLFDPLTTLFAVIVLAGLVAAAVWTAPRWRLASFAIWWVLLHLVIESSVIPLELAYEHRMYLPLAGLVWLVGGTLFTFSMNPRWAWAASAAIVVLLTFATLARNDVWRSEVALWQDVAVKYPHDARAHNNVGSALASQGRHEDAMSHHREAVRLRPDYANAHNNLGIALAAAGDMAAAVVEYRAALEADPDYTRAHNNLGNALLALGDMPAALAHYRRAIELEPQYADAHYNLAAALAATGDAMAAREHYHLALAANPEFFQAANNLGALLAAAGELPAAAAQLRAAIELKPDYVDALANLASVLEWQGDIAEARRLLRQAQEAAQAQGNHAARAAIQERLRSLGQ